MGGYGSGNHYRWAAKGTTAGLRRLDVRALQRCGRLAPGGDFRWWWSDGSTVGIRVGELTTEGRALLLALRYHYQRGAGAWEEVAQVVALAWTPCHYGGWRPWFHCGVTTNGVYCGRRVALLYGAGRYFACRQCYDLAYPSTRAEPRDRALMKAQAIRVRLGGRTNITRPCPPTPPRMNWPTYWRGRGHAGAAETVYDAAIWAWLARSDAWLNSRYGDLLREHESS